MYIAPPDAYPPLVAQDDIVQAVMVSADASKYIPAAPISLPVGAMNLPRVIVKPVSVTCAPPEIEKQRYAFCPSTLYKPCPSIVRPVRPATVIVLVRKTSAPRMIVFPEDNAEVRAD